MLLEKFREQKPIFFFYFSKAVGDALTIDGLNSNLWGQNLRSSSDGFNSKSTKDFPLESLAGSGGGSSSTAQILFLANPCCSSEPQLPNYV